MIERGNVAVKREGHDAVGPVGGGFDGTDGGGSIREEQTPKPDKARANAGTECAQPFDNPFPATSLSAVQALMLCECEHGYLSSIRTR